MMVTKQARFKMDLIKMQLIVCSIFKIICFFIINSLARNIKDIFFFFFNLLSNNTFFTILFEMRLACKIAGQTHFKLATNTEHDYKALESIILIALVLNETELET
jgi:hypothetical protein